MDSLPTLFLYAAILAFILAVIGVFAGPLAGVPAEGFSRACSNLALMAIGFSVVAKPGAMKG